MRIGLFGGTFDPPHLGHLILAERCREAAALDEVRFLVSFQPPHKLDRTMSRFEMRCEMAELATVGQPAFQVERIEAELPPPSYTAETLRVLRERQPNDDFHLIIGGDSLVDLPGWYQPQRVIAQAGIIAVPRPGIPVLTASELARRLGVPDSTVRLTIVESPLVDISSTEIRRRVGLHQTIRYLVPRAVEEYLREKRLYLA
jgi:nicotinate-nucleotide adenylyltransferase